MNRRDFLKKSSIAGLVPFIPMVQKMPEPIAVKPSWTARVERYSIIERCYPDYESRFLELSPWNRQDCALLVSMHQHGVERFVVRIHPALYGTSPVFLVGDYDVRERFNTNVPYPDGRFSGHGFRRLVYVERLVPWRENIGRGPWINVAGNQDVTKDIASCILFDNARLRRSITRK
jgi:hypothetical protein